MPSVTVRPEPPTGWRGAADAARRAVATSDLRALTRQFPQAGRIEAIWLRPQRGAPSLSVGSAVALAGRGLEGDRSAARAAASPDGHKRQITLIQAEHLPLIGAWLGREDVDAGTMRRNLVVSGLNLLAARSPWAGEPLQVHLGDAAIIEITGPCDPCSKMEATLGPGGYNAMRGHGGVTARVRQGGTLSVGDAVWVTSP